MEENKIESVPAVDQEKPKRINFSLPNKLPKLRVPGIVKRHKRISAGVLVLLLVVLFFSFAAISVYVRGKAFYEEARNIAVKAEAQDIAGVKEALPRLKEKQKALSSSYALLTPLRLIPFMGSYIADGSHALKASAYGIETGEILIDTVEPYSDILGLSTSSEPESDSQKNAQDRLDFIVQTLPGVMPKVDELSNKLTLVKNELVQINPARYPSSLFGKKVREPLETGINLVVEADDFVSRGKPLLKVSPYLLGSESKREYLVLFQNDKELRPTGGFLTAYSIADVEKGKFNPVNSSDIYSLDANYHPSVPAPEEFIKYIQGPYVLNKNFRIRDINWSPDFRESTELFLNEAQKVGIENVDGVIAVDTQLLVNILDVLGPIGVPGFGNFSNDTEPKCNCPQVIYELESFADVEGPIVWDPLDPTKIIYAPANIDNRKKIIGPLMNSILSNALAQPKEKLPDLFEAVYKSVTEKHVLLYLRDEESQKAAEDFGIAGRVADTGGDYLMINDANLGGRKSNLYVTQEVRQGITVAKDGSVEKTLEIIYKNPQSYDGWLNSVLPNWTRVYLPKGSEIVDVSGFEDNGGQSEEFGKTVISGGFKLRPQGISTISITYKLPFKVTDGKYNLLMQKQPGTDSPLYSVEINGQEDEFYLRTDTEKSYKVK